MKSLTQKLVALQLFGLGLTAFLILFALRPMLEDGLAARFNDQGQALTKTLARSCSVALAHGKPKALPHALTEAQAVPGVAWACILMRDGRTLCLPGSSLSKPLTHLLRTKDAARTALAPPDSAQALTVFRQSLPNGSISAVDVALSDDYLDMQVRRVQGEMMLGLAAVWIAVTVMIAWVLQRSYGALGDFLRAVRGVSAAAPLSPPKSPLREIGALATAINSLLTRVQKREQDVSQIEALCRSTVEDAVIGFWQSTPEGRIVRANRAMAQIYGYETAEEFMQAVGGISHDVYVDAEHRPRSLRQLMEKGMLRDCETQIKHRDGRVIWISETARVVRNTQGRIESLEGTVEDITPRKKAEAERSHLANHLRLLLESSGEGIYGVDLQGHCTFINKAGAQMLGYGTNVLLSRNIHEAIHHSHADRTVYPEERGYVYNSMRTGRTCRVDNEVLWRKDGKSFPVEYTAAPLTEGGQIVGAVVTFVDITQRKALDTERERLLAEAIDRADHDPLTGLLNHRAFQRRLEEEADRAQRGGGMLAIALLDIDNFKFFNDVYGHKVGDEVLQKVAAALHASSRSYDSLSRFGGDEFAVLMPCKGDETATDLAAQLRQRLAGVSYRPEGYDQAIPLGLSVGLALFPSEGAARNDVLELADERLRRSKTGGDDDGYAESVRESLNHSREGFSMLDALVTAVDNKDRYTRRHSEDVMRYCVEIADEMGIDPATRRLLEMAALIHDVGKIGVPDHILRKPGQLSDEEFAAVRQHPTMGAVIAEAVPGFEETLDAIRHHHERWDGKGYPSGLRGDETPFMARIMAVADAFSAMTTDRPYRKGMPHSKALGILAEGSGVQWDPACVEAFLRVRQSVTVPTA
jgi:diguanylate cyclase (GGDEF)-like protein/PAS domain S-box-containing protein